MTNEKTKSLLQEAAFIHQDDTWFRIDYCDDSEFYYSDEETGEQYCESYDDIDLTSPDVLLYKITLIDVT